MLQLKFDSLKEMASKKSESTYNRCFNFPVLTLYWSTNRIGINKPFNEKIKNAKYATFDVFKQDKVMVMSFFDKKVDGVWSLSASSRGLKNKQMSVNEKLDYIMKKQHHNYKFKADIYNKDFPTVIDSGVKPVAVAIIHLDKDLEVD